MYLPHIEDLHTCMSNLSTVGLLRLSAAAVIRQPPNKPPVGLIDSYWLVS